MPSPTISARSGTGGTGGLGCHSLEISASVETDAPLGHRNRPGAVGLGSVSEDPEPARPLQSQCGTAKAWQELRLELEAITTVFKGVQELREKQAEYLNRLRFGRTKGPISAG